MDPHIQKREIDVEERIKLLPRAITNLVTEGFVKESVANIVNIYILTPQQQALLTNEICLVLLMFIPRSDFALNITESLGLEADQANTITEIVDLEIFSINEDVNTWLATYDQKIHTLEDQTKDGPLHATVPVASIRTMQKDADQIKINDYASLNNQPDHSEEKVIEATSQADTLAKRPNLASLPTYHQNSTNE